MLKKTIFIFCLLSFCFVQAQLPTFAWVDRIPSVGSPDNSIAVDAYGNVYTTGYFGGVVDFDPGPGTYTMNSGPGGAMFISKVDAAGNFISATMVGGPGPLSSATGTGIEIDGAGNIFVTGYFYSGVDFDPGPGSYILWAFNVFDVFVLKLDASYNFVWAKSFGNVGWDKPHGLALDNNANVLVTGEFYFTCDFDPGPGVYNLTSPNNTSDCFIWKLDSAGNFLWARKIGGPGTSSPITGDLGREITTDIFGNVITVGYFDTIVDFDPGPLSYTIAAKNAQDAFMSKLDANGNFVWATTVGSSCFFNEDCWAVTSDAFGNVYFAGNFCGLTDFDPGPGTFTLTSSSGSGYFTKLDALGNLVWVKQINCTSSSITLNPSGHVCSSGLFSGNTDFDPGPGTFTISGGGACINMLDANGNFVWAGKIADYNFAEGFEIVSDLSGNIHTTGYFYGTHDFDPGPGTYTLTSIAGYDAFTHKLNCSVVGVSKDQKEISSMTVFPNPNDGLFKIKLEREFKNGEIQIFNNLGQRVFSQKINEGINLINSDQLSEGLYQYVLLENEIKVDQGKIVIE
jgi:hypothetical protein